MSRRFVEFAIAAIAAVAALSNISANAAGAQHRTQAVAPAAATAKGNCVANTIGYHYSNAIQSTTSKTFVDVLGMKSAFKQATPGCVIVGFASEAETAASETMVVQAVLDGVTLCKPDDNYFVSSGASPAYFSDHAMNYICPGVSPGGHYIKMQFRSFGGGAVALDYRTMIVHYQK